MCDRMYVILYCSAESQHCDRLLQRLSDDAAALVGITVVNVDSADTRLWLQKSRPTITAVPTLEICYFDGAVDRHVGLDQVCSFLGI
ncbi:hypothetical protein [Red seabream iridovirus]|uniref:ORF055L n=4 Tax=Infectious spleen and kidney necrosis virus TaxID=180170 RepID=Q5YF32_ISKNV|nr:ORF055L [Rock bream iridovirus]AAX82367.1 ORF58L [Orange-spotted grouper iridovirus]QIQ54619.1 ORF054 [Red seabream iridovirus]QYK20584.1 053L [Spotted knifejaw iridovirus]UWH19208.1 hypothetical protein [Infectious spleen and kidney necrosis virus]